MAKNKRASAERVRLWEDSTIIPTSEEGLPDPNPPFEFFNPGRFRSYPYTLRHNLADRRQRRRWRRLCLENKYLKCCVLPDLGGHLYACIDKISNRSIFYGGPSIKFARVAHRGTWAALGVEFNFPVSHNWMTSSPVDFAMTREADGGGSIWIGNIDRVYGMQWRVQLTLRPGRAYLEQKTTLYNRSDIRHRFYWWTNAAVEVSDDSRICYPMQFTAGHDFADIDSWPVDSMGVDRSLVGNHKHGPVSRFSYGSREPYMAVYHPRTRSGVVHYSSPLDLPSKKIWSWGCDEDGLEWRNALSDNDSAYVEIQAGLFRDQETYGFLEPQETRCFTEYWIPLRDLEGVSRASPEAVLSLHRQAASKKTAELEVMLNVTRELPKAQLRVLDGLRPIRTVRASLSPQRTFRTAFTGLRMDRTYSVELRDASGKMLLAHTEGKYDFTDAQVRTGKTPGRSQPAESDMGVEDFLESATRQESNGDLLGALKTYQRGLARFRNSIALNRAIGRLEATLKQYEAAVEHLGPAVASVSIDHEAAYYLGLALAATGDDRQARVHWEFSQQSRSYHAPALCCLAALEARGGNRERALEMIQDAPRTTPGLVRAGGVEVALLRVLGRRRQAKKALAGWTERDPANSLLRYESTRLGARDPALLAHLAGDPERILDIAVDYLRFGLFEDALDVLSRKYPSGAGVVSEPGMPHPSSYPLIAYYRGFCRYALDKDGRRDFEAASRMPTRYVFPNRSESFAVLRRAIDVNPHDSNAHFLLGSLYLSGGMSEQALAEWEIARRKRPAVPTLHRNMGYTVLRSGGSPEQAMELLREGTKYDPRNADVFLGLEEAMEKAGYSAGDRGRVLLSFPALRSAPSGFVFRLVQVLGEAGRFDAAERALRKRFFPREEGGTDVREVYVALRLKRARQMAAEGQCGSALVIVRQLGDAVPDLFFTARGLGRFVASEASRRAAGEIEAMCRKPAGIAAP
jgi:tetratricopeptide (TPR) repeat protein